MVKFGPIINPDMLAPEGDKNIRARQITEAVKSAINDLYVQYCNGLEADP